MPKKNPGYQKGPGLSTLNLFSGLFKVARNPVTNCHWCLANARDAKRQPYVMQM